MSRQDNVNGTVRAGSKFCNVSDRYCYSKLAIDFAVEDFLLNYALRSSVGQRAHQAILRLMGPADISPKKKIIYYCRRNGVSLERDARRTSGVRTWVQQRGTR